MFLFSVFPAIPQTLMVEDLPPPLERIYPTSKVYPVTQRAELVEPHQRAHLPNALLVSSVKPAVSAGMKKGFLNTPKLQKPVGDHVLLNPPSPPAANSLVFPEVQSALGREWMTPGLMDSVRKDPEVMEAVNDPKFMELLDLMKKDPRRARLITESDARMDSMLRRWAGLLGTHFEMLTGSADQARDDRVLSPEIQDPALQQILNDSQVQQLIELMRTGGRVDPREILSRNPVLGARIKILIERGLLTLTK